MQGWVLCDMFYMRGVENVDVIVDRSSGPVGKLVIECIRASTTQTT